MLFYIFLEHGSGAVRVGVRRVALRRLQPSRTPGESFVRPV